MGDPITIAAAAFSMASSVAGGMAAKENAAFERQQYEDKRQTALLAAEQEEAARRKQLQTTLATQDAIRAGRGLDLYGGTAEALRQDTIDVAERDIATARLNKMSEARSYGLAADQASASGKNAMFGGFLSGAANAASIFVPRK